jgi:3D (Asp-Asp-Asp) domain-containing protein
MKNNNIVKNLIVLAICVSILLAITAYMALTINKVSEKLAVTKDALATTQNELSSAYESLSSYQGDFSMAREALISEQNKNTLLQSELYAANVIIADLKSEDYDLVYIGDFTITYYCDERYSHICGGNGVTASGKQTEVGVTAAADWSVLPKGSQIYIEGIGFREVQDVGGGVNGNHIDVLVQSHDEALSLGTSSEGVWLLVKTNS